MSLTNQTREVNEETDRPSVHAHRTAKVVELVASSTDSFEDAVAKGIHDAAETTRGITGSEVTNFNVRCNDGNVVEWRATMRIAFGIERTPSNTN